MAETKQPPAAEEPEESLADAVRVISAGMKRLTKSGLNRTAIVVLLKDSTGVGKKEIEKVLTGLDSLATKYTVPK